MTKTKKKKHRISKAGKNSLIKFSNIRNKTRGLAKRDNRYIISFFIMLIFTLTLLAYMFATIFDTSWIHGQLLQNIKNRNGSPISFTYLSDSGHKSSMTIFISILTWSKPKFNTIAIYSDPDIHLPVKIYGTWKLMDGIVYFQIIFIISIITTILLFYFWFTGKNKSLFFNTKLNWHLFIAIFVFIGMGAFTGLTANPLDTLWSEIKDGFGISWTSTIAPGTIMETVFIFIALAIFIISFSLWFYNVRHIDPDADPIKFVKVGGKFAYKTGSTVVKLIVKAMKGVVKLLASIGWL